MKKNGKPVPRITVFGNKVLIDRQTLEAMSLRTVARNQMIRGLQDRLENTQTLLRSALHELGQERGLDPQRFARTWERDHRASERRMDA